MARAGTGAPAEFWRSSCRIRSSACARPISIRRRAARHDSTRLAQDEAWVEGRSLIATVNDLELLDPELSSERLAYRLFHERGVRVFRAAPVQAKCSCSRNSVENMLRSFSQSDRDDMVENGRITVTCEFCNSTYVFQPKK